ncbi:hypothetical protein WJX84_009865 [Apatococcus fuscideae]|uniref:BHLH domain-containing protein n=1 Tax=Apatococcus fuscideae TaxID=2026836 RepID=A0AAW1SM28_9CHLO
MEHFANASLATSPAVEASISNLNKRARLSENLSRFSRPQEFGAGPRSAGQAEADQASHELGGDLCEDGKNGKKSVMSHVATEQRRRDRINEGFNALRDLIPHKDKMDKATFLQQTVEYIKQLQAVMHQLLAMGAIKNLPEDTQWSIRLLLPRKTEEVSIPPPSAVPAQVTAAAQQTPASGNVAANPAASAMMNSAQYLPYMLQQHQPQQQPQQQQPASMMGQTQMQVSEAPNGMHAQQLQQQLNQMPQQQQQQTSMPTQSSAPTVELKAPNNQSQTVQLDLSNVNNMLQLQALLQQSQMQMAQQQAVRNLWGAGQDTSPWTMNQLQHMMQPQSQLNGLQLPPETLSLLANQQHALNLLLPQGAQTPAPQQNPPAQNTGPQPNQMLTHQQSNSLPPMGQAGPQPTGQMGSQQLAQASSGHLPQMISQVSMGGCGSSPQATSSEPSSPDKLDGRGPAKARKNSKVRRHTTASKIAKPPTAGPGPQAGAGRPEALNLSG